MAVTLKDESIANEWTNLIDRGAGNEKFVLDLLTKNLLEAQIPGGCKWSMEEVQSAGFFSKVRRNFLIVDLEQFKDYHMYICVRDYGIHLDCCRFLTVEPGVFKKWASEKLTGYADALSAPKNILIHQDLRAWATVVHHAMTDAVGQLMAKIGQDPTSLNKTSKGILEIW